MIKSALNSIMQPQRKQTRLGMRLVQSGLISETQLHTALEKQAASGQFLGETLLDLGLITIESLAPHLEATTGAPFVRLTVPAIFPNRWRELNLFFPSTSRVR
ncbi:MAG: hypothetical protein NT023_21640 [Armatimonadetes bacterium]|nr:hypothetical protein [Armatimonadota bacterium]